MRQSEQDGAHLLAELDATPPAELRRRAAIVTALSGGPASFSQKTVSYRVDGATRFAWNDSGGQSVQWYFTDGGRALLIAFEHEGELNIPGRPATSRFSGPTIGASPRTCCGTPGIAPRLTRTSP
ncbi:hypothetical protein ACFYT4_21815 [Streptomyces sp. NPDC004609]|uniref:hypothetical protein n=1 Tax=Streptomyces sp. NPDC004609 TaxID=3364704 RepID=UPI0036A1EEC2